MDSRDLFKQLTCGINFAATRKNNSRKRAPPNALNGPLQVKKEKIEPVDSGYDGNDVVSDVEVQFDVDRMKREQEDGDDADEEKVDPNNLNIFGSIVIPNLPQKKKKVMTEEKRKALEVQRINELRNKHHLHVTGRLVPAPVETFAEMQIQHKLPEQLIQNLASCGYAEPTPIQMQAIPIMALGHSLLACAPTGSGKTATFLVPIVRDLRKPRKLGFRALILCPTRELAKQTQRECLRLVEDIGLRVHTLSKTNQAESRYGVKSNQKFDILVTTPNRVCHLLAQSPPVLDFSNVKWLVLDEADKLFEEGTKSFRHQFDQIYAACSHADRRVALFSATWTNPVAKWLRQNVKGAQTVAVGQRNSATDLVDQELLFVGSEAGKLLAFRELVRTGLQPPVLVFVDTKDRAEQLYKELIYDGINVDLIHADRSQQQRDLVVKAFREGKIWVLICTELIGRGIDFKGVNLVVNYDFPPSAIAYIHRIGRTGRAGRRGRAVTYFTQDDTVNLKAIAKILNNSGCAVPAYMLAMKDHSKRAKNKLLKERKPREAIRPGDKKKGGGGGGLALKKKAKAKTPLVAMAKKAAPGKPKLNKEKRQKKKKSA